MVSGLDMHDTDHAQHINTADEDLYNLKRDTPDV